MLRYGSHEDIEVIDIEIPKPKDKQVLVKVKAASLNATDIEILRGDPIIRIANGFRKPKNKRLGCDLAGIVDEVGEGVTTFGIGDEIYVDVMYQSPAYGALGEYILVKENRLRLKPPDMSFEQAATIPQAGVLALQGIIEPNPPTLGTDVLVIGAGGGVGSFAVQIAKYYGATVTGVDHPSKFDFMKNLGVDHLISYVDDDYTRLNKKYDIVLDVVGKKSVWRHRKILKPNGRYRMVGGPFNKIMSHALIGGIVSILGSKSIGLLIGRPNDAGIMKKMTELYRDGAVKPAIGDTFNFHEIHKAMKKLFEGTAFGKIVITFD